MLLRYIKLTIDPATAGGWAVNDAGQHLYYQDGKVLTGRQNISSENQKKWYYFNTDGSLEVSTKIDGYEVDENGVRQSK